MTNKKQSPIIKAKNILVGKEERIFDEDYSSMTRYDYGILGAMAGTGIGVLATIVGGYELGSVINDYLNIANNAARIALDLAVMGVVYKPATRVGTFVGVGVGMGLHPLLSPVIRKAKELRHSAQKQRRAKDWEKFDESTDWGKL